MSRIFIYQILKMLGSTLAKTDETGDICDLIPSILKKLRRPA